MGVPPWYWGAPEDVLTGRKGSSGEAWPCSQEQWVG